MTCAFSCWSTASFYHVSAWKIFLARLLGSLYKFPSLEVEQMNDQTNTVIPIPTRSALRGGLGAGGRGSSLSSASLSSSRRA